MNRTVWWLCLLYLLGIISSMTGCDAYDEKGLCSYLFGCGDDGDEDGDQPEPSSKKNKTPGE